MEVQPFPQATYLLRKLVPLWEHGINNSSQNLCRGPNGRPYFMEDSELQWANPSIKFSILEELTRALAYLRVLLSSKDHTHCLSLCQQLSESQGPDYTIVSRWRSMIGQDMGSLLVRLSPLVIDNAAKQLSIERSLSQRAAA